MKKFTYFALTSAMAFVPMLFVSAATLDEDGVATEFLTSVLEFINTVLIPFILGVAFLLFVWGMFQYFIAGGANDEAKEKGKSLLIYAILGFVIIIVFWGIINLVTGATGLQADLDVAPGAGPAIGG